jgi:hypothetical protein
MVCAGCGQEATGGARGWRAYLDVDDELVCYCRRCALRKVGPITTRILRFDNWNANDPRDLPADRSDGL